MSVFKYTRSSSFLISSFLSLFFPVPSPLNNNAEKNNPKKSRTPEDTETDHETTTTTTTDREENDDGLGSSDDETISSGSTATIGEHEDIDRDADDEDLEEEDHGSVSSGESRGFESDSSPNLKAVVGRKVIKPDASAINQLLAFDEVGKRNIIMSPKTTNLGKE